MLVFGELFMKTSVYLQGYPQSLLLIHIKSFFSLY